MRRPLDAARETGRTPDDVDRALEARLLRERGAELVAEINDVETALAEREATIDTQRERLAARTADADGDEQPDTTATVWRRLRRWLGRR